MDVSPVQEELGPIALLARVGLARAWCLPAWDLPIPQNSPSCWAMARDTP